METLFDLWSNLSNQSVQLAINAIWIGLALTGGAWLMLRWAGQAAAVARLALWWAVLVIVLAIPLLVVSPLDKMWSDSQPLTEIRLAEPRISTPTAPVPVESQIDPDFNMIATERSSQAPSTTTPKVAEAKHAGNPLALRLLPITLTLIWVSGVLLLISRLGLAYSRMRAIKFRSEAFDTSYLVRVNRLVHDSSRPIEIRQSNDIAVPIAAGLGRPMILIPHQLIEALSDSELEAVILHELAHFNRWDDWSKLTQKMIEALFFFHPAIHIICHQLELERELACDEWAIAQTGTADRYAKCLTRLVQLTSGTATTLIPGALSNRKQIFRRFERLLAQASTKRSPRHAKLKLFSLAAIVGFTALFAVQMVPAIGLPLEPVSFTELISPDETNEVESSEVEATDKNNNTVPSIAARRVSATRETAPPAARTIGTAYVDGDKIYGATTRRRGQTITTTYNSDDYNISAAVRGEVELSKDSRSILRLSRNASLEFTYVTDSEERRLLVERGPNRDLDYIYSLDNELHEYDHDAQDWFAGVLESFVAKTGFGAEPRLREVLTEEGLQYCLEFIEKDVEPDVQRYYYEKLMVFDHLGFRDLRQIRQHAAETLADDYDRDYIEEEATKRLAYMRQYSRNEMSVTPDVSYVPALTSYASERSSSSLSSRSSSSSRSSGSSRSSSSSRSRYRQWSDDDESWFSVGDSDNLTTFIGNTWTRAGRDWDTEGEWEARFNRSRNRVQLTMEGYDSDYRLSFPVLLDDLEGLTRDQIVDGTDEVTFSYQRGPGTFHFTGDFRRGRGGGEFTFETNPEFVETLKTIGYKTSRLTEWRMFELAIHDVSLEYIEAMNDQGLGRIRLDKLVEMRIHDIEPEFVAEFADLGYDRLSADELIAFAIHDVDPDLVRDMQALDVRGLDGDAIVQLAIHDIAADFVREFAELGYDGLSVDELVQFGIHDVDADLVRELRDLNIRGLDEDAMIQLSIHDIDADFVREFAEIGYDGLSVDELVQFGIHDVDPDLVRELKDLNIRGLDEDAMIQLSIHDIDADFVREFVEIGYDRLSVDRLVQFGIHDVNARYVKDLAELGYKDISADDLVQMKIHDVTPSFIRRLHRKGYDDLSPDDMIDIKIHGYY